MCDKSDCRFTAITQSGEAIHLKNTSQSGEEHVFCSEGGDIFLSVGIKQPRLYASFTILGFSCKNEAFGKGRVVVNVKGAPGVKALPFDYMTFGGESAEGQDIEIAFPRIWDDYPGNPKGGFALYKSESEDEEDECILQIWANEAMPHPKIEGEWNYEAARTWVDRVCCMFEDQSLMYITGRSVDELKKFELYLKAADSKIIYLFTDVWQRWGGFWPHDTLNWEVGPESAFGSEEGLVEYSKYLEENGYMLGLHYVSGGIGFMDPQFAGGNISGELAAWVKGELADGIDKESGYIIFRPENEDDIMPPSAVQGVKTKIGSLDVALEPYNAYFNHFLVGGTGGELMRAESYEKLGDGSWKIKVERAANATKNAGHSTGAPVRGLVTPYNMVYIPENNSNLLETVAGGYAGMLNRVASVFIAYDGSEIHHYDGYWGYLKFATKVYENIDHPALIISSAVIVPERGYIEYKLNRVQKIMRSPMSDGVTGRATLRLERLDTTHRVMRACNQLMEANFMLGIQAGVGGRNFSIMRPDPMFGISLGDYAEYGRTDELLALLPLWKDCSSHMSEEQRRTIRNTFDRNYFEQPGYYAGDRYFQIADNGSEYLVCASAVMCDPALGKKFYMLVESGAFAPRMTMKSGERATLRNIFGEQQPDLILRYLPENTGALSSVEITLNDGSMVIEGILNPGNYVEFDGTAAKVYDKNWNFINDAAYTLDRFIAKAGENMAAINAKSGADAVFEMQLITKGEAMVVPKTQSKN